MGDRLEDCTLNEPGEDNCSDDDNGTVDAGKSVSVLLLLLFFFFSFSVVKFTSSSFLFFIFFSSFFFFFFLSFVFYMSLFS